MAAGVRSLFAFWSGGAGSEPVTTQAGVRSLLAPWAGGASAAEAPAAAAGVRSLLAPWMGGAAAGEAPSTIAGYRSLFAAWAGGASASASVEPPAEEPPGGTITRHRVRRRVQRVYPPPVHDINEDDDEMAALRMLGLH